MARSTFAMTLVMLMLPATALRNKDRGLPIAVTYWVQATTRESTSDFVPVSFQKPEDDAVTMQAGISEARDPEAELSSWLLEVGLSYADAGWWAQKESWSQCSFFEAPMVEQEDGRGYLSIYP